MSPEDVTTLKAEAEKSRDWKQCIGAIRGCPHCTFEVSPVQALELISEIERLRQQFERLKASGDCCTCCVENDCDCMEGVTW